MMTPFLSVTGGGDQENTTSLSPATAVNSTGEPDGAEREKIMTTPSALAKERNINGARVTKTSDFSRIKLIRNLLSRVKTFVNLAQMDRERERVSNYYSSLCVYWPCVCGLLKAFTT